MRDGDAPLWVFGYGSLIWKTEFEYEARLPATLHGFRRSFCLRSVRWRGTPEAPGLVLGLAPDAGAACRGVAFRVAPERAAETRAYLHHREMGTASYFETFQTVEIDGPAPDRVPALSYVMDTSHPQYAPLPLEAQAEIIARSHGPAGPNRDYLHNTVSHLRALGLPDPELERLDGLVRAMPADADPIPSHMRSAP